MKRTLSLFLPLILIGLVFSAPAAAQQGRWDSASLPLKADATTPSNQVDIKCESGGVFVGIYVEGEIVAVYPVREGQTLAVSLPGITGIVVVGTGTGSYRF